MKKKSKGERQVFLLASGKVSYFFSLKKIPATKDEIKSSTKSKTLLMLR